MKGSNWIENNFCKRECIKFIPSTKDNARCCCGHLWRYHQDGSPATLRTQESNELHWGPSRHTQLHSTDSYGTIEFQGGPHPSKAQYIRLSHDSHPSQILELLTREWGLNLPKLLISIQGGKTNFDLQPKLKKVIRKGLLKAAKTTGAWVFTAGLNTGVTRQVGEALASEYLLRDRNGRIASIGIAPWGVVERRHELIGRNVDVPYHPINSPKSRYAALNNHHSFFLLVDNGTAGKYGAEIILRRKLENYISQQRIQTRGGLATPVVCVVIEGGPQTIRQVLEYVTDSPPIPVIVCDGTGRAADILAFIHKFASSDQNIFENIHSSVVSTIERVFDLNSEQAEKLFIELRQCVKKKDLITVFRLKSDSELDQSILSALLYSKKIDPPEQLSLALTWNRVDIARSHVFNENVEWPEDSLEQAMMDALVNDRLAFINLLLQQGVSMGRFLTIQRLEDLYSSSSHSILNSVMRDIRKPAGKDYKFSLIDVGLAINKLMGGAFRSSYTKKKFQSSLINFQTASPIGKIFGSQKDRHHTVFEYPFSELMVWAVLTKKQPLALLMWQHGEEAIAKALVAAKLYKALAHEAVDDDLETEVYEELRNYAKEFEALALDVLDFCYRQDEMRANQLLTYELKNWSKQTCLALAVSVNHRAFLSHPCCQILLADLWLGGLRTRKNTNIKVILGLLCPPIIYILEFRSREELRCMPQTCEEHWEEEPNYHSDSERSSTSESDNMDIRNDHDPEIISPFLLEVDSNVPKRRDSSVHNNGTTYHLSLGHDLSFNDTPKNELPSRIKFYEFFNAPITKFWAHSIAYIFFLGIFTYIVLVKLPYSPNWQEWYVFVYISTFLAEKVREIIANEPIKLIKKLTVWSEKLWNVFDLFFTLLYLLGFCLRLQEGAVRDAGRVIYCVDIIYWYLKVLEILSANKYLGPLVMIMGKMLKNMAYFVILLLVVLMAFGVCRQSILFPNEEPNWRLIRHVFYQPYFMLYGEVFAGDIDPDCGGVDEIECHPGRWITPTVMSLYLLVANILLINLLIAVFNNIFMSVHSISHQIWMFQRFQVVMEFEEKPVFPPPLIVLSHIFRVFKYLFRNFKRKPFINGHGLKVFLGGENLERIHDFEEECVDAYISEKDQRECSSTEERVRTITERTEALSQRLEDMHNQVVLSLTSLKNLDFHTKSMHEEIQQVNSNYYGIRQLLLQHFRRNEGTTKLSGLGEQGSAKFEPSINFPKSQIEAVRPSRVGVNDELPNDQELTIKRMRRNQLEKLSANGKIAIAKEEFEGPKKRKKSFKDVRHRRTKYVVMREKAHNDRQFARCLKCNTKRNYKIPFDAKRSKHPKVVFKDSDDEEFCDINGRDSLERNSDLKKRIFSPVLKKSSTQLHSTSTMLSSALTAEYTSLGDELETVCMSKFTPPLSPRLLSNLSTSTHYTGARHQSNIAVPENVVNNKPLRDAEESDYHLMEGIIQRRLHRDSENLAISLEELCSIYTSSSDDETNVNYSKCPGNEYRKYDSQEKSGLSKNLSTCSLSSKQIGEPSHLGNSDITADKIILRDDVQLPFAELKLQTGLLDFGNLRVELPLSTSAEISSFLQDTQSEIELRAEKIENRDKNMHQTLNVGETEKFNASNPSADSAETKF